MPSETSVATASPIAAIRCLDYVAIFARDLPAMRRFYADIMCFPRGRELGDIWFEYRVGSSILALTRKGAIFDEAETPDGAASLQLAFRVAPGAVDECAVALRSAALVTEGRPVVICAHRENLPLLLAAACARLEAPPPSGTSLRKGHFWILHVAETGLAGTERYGAG